MSVSTVMRGCLLFAGAAVMLTGAAAAESRVDLELVLAVDVSRSMDMDELGVQRDGYAAAFRHPDVISTIRSGPFQSIAVTYVEWAGPDHQVTVLPWALIDGEETARTFADRLLSSPPGRYTGTSISGGLMFSASAFLDNGFASERRVIDVSGDGPNNRGVPVEPVRTNIVEQGITINGLPLMVKAPYGPYSIDNLDVYYEDCVIGGPSAFLIPVHDISQLATAIRRKLVLEIAGAPPRLISVKEMRRVPRVDCLIGEKLIERWLEK
jgi:uncharacterized protein DUF1194